MIDQLQTDLENLHIERLEKHVQRESNNLQLRFDLGKALLSGRRWKEAIFQFEYASHQRNRRIRSLIYLSEAYIALSQPDQARFQLETALQEATEEGREYHEILSRLEKIAAS